jgi:hypothetical protein
MRNLVESGVKHQSSINPLSYYYMYINNSFRKIYLVEISITFWKLIINNLDKQRFCCTSESLTTTFVCGIYLVWEVPFKFCNTLAPISSCFLTDQFNVEKRTLSRSKYMSWCCTSNNTRRYISNYILEKTDYIINFTSKKYISILND